MALRDGTAAGPDFTDRFVRTFKGSEEFINDVKRFCLWLVDATPTDIRSIPEVRRRIEANRASREASTRDATKALADKATLFGENRQPVERYLFIPGVSSENRRYIPMNFEAPTIIVSDLARSVSGATLYDFGILQSAMHMAWVRNVGGRLKSDYRYSCSLVYNTFIWPDNAGHVAQRRVSEAAQAVLDARAMYPNESLAGLYDDNMPPALFSAHTALDRAVDRCYRREMFRTELQRIQFLFERYESTTLAIAEALAARPVRRRRKIAAAVSE